MPADGSAQLQVNLAFLFFGLQDDTLVVRKRYRVENPTAQAIPPEREAVRIDLPEPPAGQQTSVKITTGGTSIALSPAPSNDGQGYWLNTSMQPGESLVDVEYRIHFHAGGQPFEERFFHPVEAFYVYTYPSSLVAGSAQLLPLGVDKESGWTRYHTSGAFQPGETLKLLLKKTIPAPAPTPPPSREREIVEIPPPIARYQGPIIGGATLLLLAAALGSLRLADRRPATRGKR